MKSRFLQAVTVITGAADGIGLSLAQQFGRAGARLALLDIRADALEQAAAELRASGIEALAVAADVSDESSMTQAAATVAEKLGTVQVLWINAGVGGGGRLTQAPLKTIDWVYSVNVMGAIRTARVFYPMLKSASGTRHIGFTASSNTLGHVTPDQSAVYTASKWAALGVAEALACEAIGDGMSATIFCPTMLNTRIWDSARARPDRFGGPVLQPEERGEPWRQNGMPVEWACQQALAAAERGELYCSPVFERNVAAFEQRVATVRASLIVYQGPVGRAATTG